MLERIQTFYVRIREEFYFMSAELYSDWEKRPTLITVLLALNVTILLYILTILI